LSDSPSSRRHFVKGLLGSTSFWLFSGHRHFSEALAEQRARPYSPAFFSQSEWSFLEAACECIFPKDEVGPGATELGVAEFIDRQMDTPYGRGELWYLSGPYLDGPPTLGYQISLPPRDIYRRGIAGADAYVMKERGCPFSKLDHETKISVLSAFEGGAIHFADLPARVFFDQLRQNTMEGAFSDPIHGGNHGLGGWTMLGFPGARADFMDWVDQQGAPYPFGPVSIDGTTA